MRWQKIRTVSPGTHQSSVGGRLSLSFFSIFPNHADLTISRTRVHIHSAGAFLSNILYRCRWFFFFLSYREKHTSDILHAHIQTHTHTLTRLYTKPAAVRDRNTGDERRDRQDETKIRSYIYEPRPTMGEVRGGGNHDDDDDIHYTRHVYALVCEPLTNARFPPPLLQPYI